MKNLLLLTILLFGILSCEKDNQTPTESTKISIRLTDGPTDVEEVNIDLRSVVIFTNQGKDSIDLETNAGVYNLLDYQNGLDTLIGTGEISADTLHQVRLVLGNNNSVKVAGSVHDLKIPSGQSSGLKVKINDAIANLEDYILTLDFDAEKSLKINGNDQYRLHPVIKVVK